MALSDNSLTSLDKLILPQCSVSSNSLAVMVSSSGVCLPELTEEEESLYMVSFPVGVEVTCGAITALSSDGVADKGATKDPDACIYGD